MAIRTTLFRSKGTRAIRLPKNATSPRGVRGGVVRLEGRRRVLVPADSVWDDVFEPPGVDFPKRDQPALWTASHGLARPPP